MIRQAIESDFAQIETVSRVCGLKMPRREMLKDIFLVEEWGGRIVAFLWAGVVTSGVMAYADYLTVLPEAKGASYRLCKALTQELQTRGVDQVTCEVRLENNPSAYLSYRIMNFLGMKLLKDAYSIFVGDIERGASEWVKHQSRRNCLK